MAWLVRGGLAGGRGGLSGGGLGGAPDVLAAAEVVHGRRERMVGLLGRRSLEGALVIPGCKQVHTMGMRFALDVAFCDRDGVVIRTVNLRPWRFSTVVWRSAFAIEAADGAFERWRLTLGDVIEVRE